MAIRATLVVRQLMVLTAVALLAGCGVLQVDIEPGVTTVPTQIVVATLAVEATETSQEAPTTAPSPDPPEPPPTQTPLPTEEPEPTPSAPVVEADDPSPMWIEVRDPQHGFGMAVPCYWIVDSRRVLTITSYDYLYALANSVRSWWKEVTPPDRAFNPDVGVWEYSDKGIPPGTPMEEAAPLFFDDEVASMERVQLGDNSALLVHLTADGNPEYFANQLYFIQLTPESMMMFSPKWTNAAESPDIKAILSSVAISADVPVVLPSEPPTGPVDGRSVYINEEAGYCFQYPTEYTLEEYTPGQPNKSGPVATLSLQRPLYTVGMTVEVEPGFGGLPLAEAVDRFLGQLPSSAVQSVQRNPMELLGGMEYVLGGEPAEVLEDVPGPEGSRDLFSIHDTRLYHLTTSPSMSYNPQAAEEVHLIYDVVRLSFSYLPVGE